MSDRGSSLVRWQELLSSSYYAIAVLVVLLGFIGFVLSLRWHVDELEAGAREHPTKAEITTAAIKIDDRINTLEKHVDELDAHGNRASSLSEERLVHLGERELALEKKVEDALIVAHATNVAQNRILDILQERQNRILEAVNSSSTDLKNLSSQINRLSVLLNKNHGDHSPSQQYDPKTPQ